jgi:hypothetical protein
MFRTLPLATTTTLAFGAAVPPASAQDPTLYLPADTSLPFTGETYQRLIEARQRACQQARADGNDLGASKGILLSVLVSVAVCTAIGLLLAAIV